MDLHEASQKLKQLAIDIGRVPNRREFYDKCQIVETDIRRLGWDNILNAAGFSARESRRKQRLSSEDIFGKSVEQQIEEYQPREFSSPKGKSRILVIGDTHFPFVNKQCLEAIYEFNRVQKPSHIVQVGDLLDLYAHSKFPRSQNMYGPEEEEALGRKGAEGMWQQLIKDNPAAQCFQLWGNHDLRPAKRVLESLPTLEHVVKEYYKRLMSFDGVTTIEDYRQELIIDGIVFHHGYRSQLGSHRDYVVQNFVCGHSHKGGVVYRRLRNEVIWELNAGFCGDAESKALSYTAQKIHDQTLGWGYIDEYGPRFIAL